MSALESALSGYHSGIERLDRSARRIAGEVPEGDLAADMLELNLASRQVEANLVVVRSADDLAGSLLDLFG